MDDILTLMIPLGCALLAATLNFFISRACYHALAWGIIAALSCVTLWAVWRTSVLGSWSGMAHAVLGYYLTGPALIGAFLGWCVGVGLRDQERTQDDDTA